VNYLAESETQDQDIHRTLCKCGSKYLKKFMYKLKVDRDIGASICGSGFINYSLKCCHSDSSYAMNFHNFSGHFHH
jgi:hypothetical protein